MTNEVRWKGMEWPLPFILLSSESLGSVSCLFIPSFFYLMDGSDGCVVRCLSLRSTSLTHLSSLYPICWVYLPCIRINVRQDTGDERDPTSERSEWEAWPHPALKPHQSLRIDMAAERRRERSEGESGSQDPTPPLQRVVWEREWVSEFASEGRV